VALADWLGTIEFEDPTQTQSAFLDELLTMLMTYQPPLLDRSRSSIRDRGHAWTKANTIEVRLVHSSEPEAAIEIGLSDDEAIVAWLTAHEHITEWETASQDRPWTTQAVDAVARILRGDYEIEDTYRGRETHQDPRCPMLVIQRGHALSRKQAAALSLDGFRLLDRNGSSVGESASA
jgi:hypothetical protein